MRNNKLKSVSTNTLKQLRNETYRLMIEEPMLKYGYEIAKIHIGTLVYNGHEGIPEDLTMFGLLTEISHRTKNEKS